MSAFEEILTGNPAHEVWPYSEIVRAGDFIFVSGIGAGDQTTGEVVGDMLDDEGGVLLDVLPRRLLLCLERSRGGLGQCEFPDAAGQIRTGTRKLEPVTAIRDGRVYRQRPNRQKG